MADVGRADDERLALPSIDSEDMFTPRFAAIGNQIDRRGRALDTTLDAFMASHSTVFIQEDRNENREKLRRPPGACPWSVPMNWRSETGHSLAGRTFIGQEG